MPDAQPTPDVPVPDVRVDLSALRAATSADAPEIIRVLGLLRLSADGVGEPGCDLWVLPDAAGRIVAVTGAEYGRGGHVLLRSVAVAPPLRNRGIGRALAEHTLAHASANGCTDAWLFSRTNGAFWQHLGFRLTPTADLVAAVPHAHQVVAFTASGHLEREIAWHLALGQQPQPDGPRAAEP